MRFLAALLPLVLASWAASAEETRFGAGVTLERTTPIQEVIAYPSAFAGQTIRVEGVVTAVCEHMGCWMTLAPAAPKGGDTPAATLRLKVDDGVIVFPVSAKGRTAVAQGVLKAIGGDDHHAAEAGGQKYQLEVTGALLR